MIVDQQSPSERLEKCLAAFGSDVEELRAAAKQNIDFRDGDHLLAVGSLVEGLGNDKSDLDLLLVTVGDNVDTEEGWVLGRRMIDLRSVSARTVTAMINKLRQWAARPWDLTELAPFDYDERLLLHRLSTGIEVVTTRSSPIAQDDSYRPDHADLCRLKLQVARHLARTIQIDMVGYRHDSDYATMVLASQSLLGHGVDGLLTGFGITNPNPKWRHRLLGSLPDNWTDGVSIWPREVSAQDTYWKNLRAPSEAIASAAIEHALRCTALTRAAFAAIEPRLIHPGRRSIRLAGITASEMTTRCECLPALEFDVDFCFTDKGVSVARLNEFARPVLLSELEFSLALHCDGLTPKDGVVPFPINRSDALPLLPRSAIDATLQKLATGGLCVATSTAGFNSA